MPYRLIDIQLEGLTPSPALPRSSTMIVGRRLWSLRNKYNLGFSSPADRGRRIVQASHFPCNVGLGFQPADAGGRVKPGVERLARNPRLAVKQSPSSPRMRATARRHSLKLMTPSKLADWLPPAPQAI